MVAVESGDRIRVRLDALEMTVRLHGILCPAEPAAIFERARAFAARRIEGTKVKVVVRGTAARLTVYGDVYPVKGESLNAELVRVGLASWASQYAPNRTDLSRLEEEARVAGRGMYGDPTGDNVPLPPSMATTLKAAKPSLRAPVRPKATPKPTPTATPTATPTQIPTSTPVPATPTPLPVSATPTSAAISQPSPATVVSSVAAPPVTPSPSLTIPVSLKVMGVAFLMTSAVALGGLFFRTGRQPALLIAQSVLALLVGVATALLFPLPFLALTGRFTIQPPTITAAVLLILITLCLYGSITLYRREQNLRAVPLRNIGEQANEGLVRITGRTSAVQGTVYSKTGQIPAIYVRERSFRYDPEPGRRGRSVPHRWVERYNEVAAIDFLLTDETGSVLIEADRAEFHPLRVARFYNDVPVDQFFAESYSGDVRTEVFFLPAEANVTVWGRLFETSAALPELVEKRVGFDPLSSTLTVVEENPGRLFTNRPILSLLLTLAVVLMAFGLIVCVSAPDTVTRLFSGGLRP